MIFMLLDLVRGAARRVIPTAARRRITAAALRSTRWPPPGLVDLGDLRRTSPISGDWGFDRGTPIDRYFIDRFLTANAGSVQGRVLEIDGDQYTRAYGADRVTHSDVLHQSEHIDGVTIVGDLTDGSTIPSDAFDCVIVTQTLQLIYHPAAAVQTIHRILRPNGVALCTFPGISKMTADEKKRWGYYWGFTSLSAIRLFGEHFGAERVEVESYGNVLSASAFLFGLAAEDLRQEELDVVDTDFELLLAVRATKAGQP